ncbi:MAG: Uma2 family endonuclease [Symploca sp. SIO2C1]|nr:Uma2 family endonuclease [Symploca sp. SIO2C1]
MTHTPVKLTFEQYLEYDDGTDNRYEVFDGELVEVPAESELNSWIAKYLERKIETVVPMRQVRLQKLDLAVPVFPRMPLNRQPDLTVVRPEHIQQMAKLGKMAITLDMAPPRLVVEVVSPYRNQKDENYQRDYIDKVHQYQERGIPEYWIVDPQTRVVTVLLLVNGRYQATEFSGNQRIVSRTFPELELTAKQVLEARY